MDQTAELLTAVGALWLALSGLAGGVVKYLVDQRKLDMEKCEKKIASLEAKLDESSQLLAKQAESQQKQIDAQAQLIAGFQALLGQKATPQ